MADAKISALTSVSTPLAGTEVVPVVQSGSTKKVTVADLTAGRAVSAAQLDVDNVRIDGNTISSTNTNGNLVLDPNGSGSINLAISGGGKALVSAPIYQDAIARLSPAAGSGGTQSRIEFSDGDYQTGMLAAYGNVYGSGYQYAVMLASNTVNDGSLGGTFQYSGAARASRLWQQDGRHYLQYAASGSVGGNISWLTACSTTTSGNLAFPSGQGIDFSATDQATGMTSELLDDYEEGTWTPTLNATSLSGATYSTQAGRYTKVGDKVTLFFDVVLSALTSGGSNYVRIEGIPFATAATNVCSASVYTENLTGGTSGRYIVLHTVGGQVSIVFWEIGPDGNVGNGMQGSRLTATSRFAGCITYQAA
jgi:hypothetical protein